jgi:hypothetical protein
LSRCLQAAWDARLWKPFRKRAAESWDKRTRLVGHWLRGAISRGVANSRRALSPVMLRRKTWPFRCPRQLRVGRRRSSPIPSRACREARRGVRTRRLPPGRAGELHPRRVDRRGGRHGQVRLTARSASGCGRPELPRVSHSPGGVSRSPRRRHVSAEPYGRRPERRVSPLARPAPLQSCKVGREDAITDGPLRLERRS